MDNLKVFLLCSVLILIFFYLKHNGNILEYSQSNLPACPRMYLPCVVWQQNKINGTSVGECNCDRHSAENQPLIKDMSKLKAKCENNSQFLNGKQVKCKWNRKYNTCLGHEVNQCDPKKTYKVPHYIKCNCAMQMAKKIDTLLPFIKYFEPYDDTMLLCTEENPNTYTSECILKSKDQAKADLGAEYDEDVWNIFNKYMSTILESDEDSLYTVHTIANTTGMSLCLGSIFTTAVLIALGQAEGPVEVGVGLALGSCAEQSVNIVSLLHCAAKHRDIIKLGMDLDDDHPKKKLSRLLLLWVCSGNSWTGYIPNKVADVVQ